MSVRRLLIALLSCAAASCASAGPTRNASRAPSLLVGVAQADITPKVPIRLTGYGNRTTPAEPGATRLRAKALAFGGERQASAVLITADLIGVSRSMSDEIARRLADAGVDRAHFAFSATHTHTGPSLTGVLPYIFSNPATADERAVIDRYSAELVDTLEAVARAALADRRPARLGWAQGTASFAANRRVLKDGKWVTFGVEAGGAVDRDLPVLAVHGTDGRLRAVLASYACHATTLEARDNIVHGDWPGAAQALIEQRHPDAIAMIAIGTGADANPNPRGGGLGDVDRHARTVADEVDRLLAGPLRPVSAPPSGRFRSLDLPLAAVPARPHWEEQSKQKGAPGLFARAVLDRLDRGQPVPDTVGYPVQTWAFGSDLALVFLGGEVVADYGLRLKKELDASRLWVNAYANDVAFYVPSRRMIPEGGYEVTGSMVYYGHAAPLAEGTEDRIVRAVKELLPGYEARVLPSREAAVSASPDPVIPRSPEPANPRTPGTDLHFIDTSFENASPVWYERAEDGTIQVYLLYDHERASPNRAAGHVHILVHGAPGASLTLEFKNLDNVWNGQPGSVAAELKTMAVSADGRAWTPVPTDSLPGNRVRLTVRMPGERLFIARTEPYRLSDLDRMLAVLRKNPVADIEVIGKTVGGRDLEIVRLGNPGAPFRVFVRARAHPWESGSSWVAQGLVDALSRNDDAAKAFLRQYVLYVLPMANKDGVARGMTRFNLNGRDLNRNWDAPADPRLAPENAALERWLQRMIAAGRPPHLAIELHNDGRGLLHISRPPVPQLDRHLERMATLESLLRTHTWFTEGRTTAAFRNTGTLGDGWLQRFGIDAVVHELNCNWIEGLKDYPSAAHWRRYGADLARVFSEYFKRF